MADYPSMVALLVVAALVVRSLDTRAWTDAALAGCALGFAGLMKPPNYLIVPGILLAYLLARQLREAAVVAAAVVPSLVALTVFKERGLGLHPLVRTGGDARCPWSGGRREARSQPLHRSRSRSLEGADGPASGVPLECAARSMGSARGHARRRPGAVARCGAPRDLARRIRRLERQRPSGEHRGEHVLAPGDARLAGIPSPPRLDPSPRSDPPAPPGCPSSAVAAAKRRAARRLGGNRDLRESSRSCS